MSSQKAKYLLVIVATSLLTICATLLVQRLNNTGIISSRKALSGEEEQSYTKLTGMTPEQMARQFIEACGRDDWETAARFMPPALLKQDPNFLPRFTNGYGGMQIISLGKPFKGMVTVSGMRVPYPGIWVPYEIRLRDGQIKKWNLAIRCDNPEHRWYWDGGL